MILRIHIRVIIALVALLLPVFSFSQSGLYVPSAKPVKDMQKALTNPPVFYLLLNISSDSDVYSISDLDLLDSAFRIAFATANPNYYTMTIEGYGSADTISTRHRVDAVYRYFAMRTHSPFPIRHADNRIHCSCYGDTVETLRFEVPVSFAVYDCSSLPSSRLLLNKTVPLESSVLVTFRNNPDECVGSSRGCYVPAADSIIHGYYSSIRLARGSVYSVAGTKDTCPSTLSIFLDDHFDYRTLVESYSLVPHSKQIIISAGYIVFSRSFPLPLDSCSVSLADSIFVRVPVTQEQFDAKLKFFARVRTSRGVEYKALPTRKMPTGKGGALILQAAVNFAQLDTIYLGKRIQESELSSYFYPVNTPTEAAAFTVGHRHYVAYSVDKHGTYQLKKPFRALFRIIPEQEEESTPVDASTLRPGEEIE